MIFTNLDRVLAYKGFELNLNIIQQCQQKQVNDLFSIEKIFLNIG